MADYTASEYEVAGASAITYATIAEADAFLLWRGSDAWTNASEATKKAVLEAAVRYMDSLYWKGAKSDIDQALRFPSGYMTDTDGTVVVPNRVKEAQAIFAMRLLEDPDLLSGSGDLSQVSVPGGFSVTWARGSGGTQVAIPSECLFLLDRDLWKSGPNYTKYNSAGRGWE